MARESLVDLAVDRLLDDIVAGRLVPGEHIPAESELAERFDMSRLTLREAMKKLQARRVISTVRGRRSVVNPVAEWTDIAAILRMAEGTLGQGETSLQLLQLRRMIETGACALAATRAGEADYSALGSALRGMREASAADDVDRFVAEDMLFHDLIIHASGNVFLRIILEPLHRMLYQRRLETSRVPVVQEHAIERHTAILDALRAADTEAARSAMDAHMDQTEADLLRFVLPTGNT